MRLWMIGLVTGAVVATQLPWLLPVSVLMLMVPVALIMRNRPVVFFLGLVVGSGLVSVRGQAALQHRLPDACTGEQFQLEGKVISLPRVSLLDGDRRRQRFEFEVQSLSPGDCSGPRKVLLSWYGEEQILPGQRWMFQARLRRPWGLANGGSFNMQSWYVLTGIDAVGSARKHQATLLPASSGQRVNRWRYAISRAIEAAVPAPRVSAVLRAVSVADKSGIDPALWTFFQRLGINHLLVISGLHVGMVAGLGLILGRCLGWCLRMAGLTGQYWPEVVAVGMAVVYTSLAGFSVATQRALFMLLCFILAGVFGRSTRGWHKLLIAAVLVITVNPLSPLGSGFWLSFSAVASLLWLAHWYRPGKGPGTLVSSHLYMGLLMLPMGGFWFGGASWLSAPANLVMVPLVGLYVVPLSLAAVALFAMQLPGSSPLWQLAALPLEYLLHTVPDALGNRGLWSIQATLGSAFLAALALGLWVVPGSIRRKLLFIICWLPLVCPLRNSAHAPVLDVLDVGQGTAVLFRSGGRTLLYDTGGGNPAGANLAQSVVIPFLRSRGVERIDSLVVSHGDLDHSAGLATLLDEIPVAALWLGGGQAGLPRGRPCRAGAAWRWGEHATFQFLSPASFEGLSDNDASCVLSIEVAQKRLLLAGDVEEPQERQLVSYWQRELASDFLLVAHHGSKTSTSQSWLNRVAPQVAVINNAYGNHFGHPAPVVMSRLQGQGVRVFHTAYSGALELHLSQPGQWPVTGQRQGIKPWWM